LVLLNLAAQRTDFTVLLLNNAVKAFALLTQHCNLVFGFSPQLFVGVVKLLELSLHHITLITHSLEFGLEFAEGSRGKAKVFLSTTHLFIKTVVFSEQLLDTLFVGL
jgi:hypothetical protein